VSDSSQAATAGAVKAEGGEYKCLVRATDGKRKISTAVRPASVIVSACAVLRRLTRVLVLQLTGKQVARFLQSYSILQKVRIDDDDCLCARHPCLRAEMD
jgi:hypothetical protein